MKTKESAVANYMRSIPKRVKHISCSAIMRDGRCVGSKIVYELDGVRIEKELPSDDLRRS